LPIIYSSIAIGISDVWLISNGSAHCQQKPSFILVDRSIPVNLQFMISHYGQQQFHIACDVDWTRNGRCLPTTGGVAFGEKWVWLVGPGKNVISTSGHRESGRKEVILLASKKSKFVM
jgi:hypothetical protein